MIRTAAMLALVVVFASACGASREEDAPERAAPAEVGAPAARLATTYDGGIVVLDAESLKTVDEFALDGFLRLNPAGDDRHVFVSTGDGFRALDLGVWSDDHGDHAHHYAAQPHLTDVEVDATKPGHVVHHDGRTVLFDDGSGTITILDPEHLADGDLQPQTHRAANPHHGVAITHSDGTLVTTIGTEESRNGIQVLDAERNEVARNEDCPRVHGEAVAAEGTVVVGCETGALVQRGAVITKIASPDPYGRIGNMAGSGESPIVLGDYKTEPDAELERPTRVALIDTHTTSLRLADVGTSYSFRSLGRGPDGAALVLGTDGSLHVLDPVSGVTVNRIAVVAPWTEPDEWQAPRPTLTVLGDTAFVTEPDKRTLHAVDLVGGRVTASAVLPQLPNELVGVTG